VKTHVIVGDPKEKICEAAAKLKADLLVMGCRAIGPIKRFYSHFSYKYLILTYVLYQ
jgi:nucleotide-binding universal stress UspA family protein